MKLSIDPKFLQHVLFDQAQINARVQVHGGKLLSQGKAVSFPHPHPLEAVSVTSSSFSIILKKTPFGQANCKFRSVEVLGKGASGVYPLDGMVFFRFFSSIQKVRPLGLGQSFCGTSCSTHKLDLYLILPLDRVSHQLLF